MAVVNPVNILLRTHWKVVGHLFDSLVFVAKFPRAHSLFGLISLFVGSMLSFGREQWI